STTFCPRLLLIDYKSKFGSLSHINALNVGEEDAPVDSKWACFGASPGPHPAELISRPP
ncbi:hypothetical protein JB92DRAFT_3014230, partial [Gautieria morchelliformis]